MRSLMLDPHKPIRILVLLGVPLNILQAAGRAVLPELRELGRQPFFVHLLHEPTKVQRQGAGRCDAVFITTTLN